jgi:hypothetical protein
MKEKKQPFWVYFLVIVLMFFFALLGVISFFLPRKCKFHRRCKKFRKNSHTCTKTSGMYYGGLLKRPPGCFTLMEEESRGAVQEALAA